MIFKNAQGRTIGKLVGGTFKKTVSKSRHLMKVNNSWGIQESVLQQLSDNTRIEIFEKEAKILYSTTAKEFRRHCTYLEFKDGLQAFLSLDKFNTIGG